jgi:type VI secretion system protein ImpK
MRDAGYFMAALADEIFLTLPWDGKEAWSQHLLEGRLYESHAAGETVFARAEQVLGGGEDRETAAVILCALALGFEGQFRGRGAAGERAIRDLKGRLLSFIHRGGLGGSQGGDGLFPQVYQHTLETQPVVRLPRVASWTLLVVFLIALQLVISHWVWVDLSASIREVTQGLVWLQDGPQL